ncbi:MAG: M14 family metallopeptidase [Acetanaerobacterium sp.]
MLKEVVSIGLPVDEQLIINKNRLVPNVPTGHEKRVCIVTGTHGDELDGQYVCYELTRRINESPHLLTGIVDIYPALNPLGMDCISRGIPMFDLDMNSIFPGSETGACAEYIAAKVTEDILGADMCIDIHSSNIFLRELPQVRVSDETAKRLLPYARLLNVDMVWVYRSLTVLEATLAYSLNSGGVPTLVVEMGVGMRIDTEYGDRLVDGIFGLLHTLGMWQQEPRKACEPMISTDHKVSFVSAEASGVFLPRPVHGKVVEKGEPLGKIVNPTLGRVEKRVTAPCGGVVFTLREYPVVYEGALLARILEG